MEEIKAVFASNLIKLRTQANMTQAQLAEKLNYSDKSISKWERAEALPDITVAKAIADEFGVSVDFMLTSHDEWKPKSAHRSFSAGMVALVAILAIWTLATLVFAVFWILGQTRWVVFMSAVPLSLIALLIFNSLWMNVKNNIYIVAALVLSIFLLIYFVLLEYNPWQILLVAIPAEALVFFSFQIKDGISLKRNVK